MSYYTDHDGLPTRRWDVLASSVGGGLLGAGITELFLGHPVLAIVLVCIGVVPMVASAVELSSWACDRRFERRRVAKIEADQAAGVWPRM